MRRDGAELDGRFNYDVDGTLSGNWFADDLPPAASQNGDAFSGSRQLAFARDAWHPDRLRVSIGGLGMTALTANGVVIVPIRSGVGLRLGANIGYLAYSRQRNILPF